jgi:hypothetical protein
MRNWYLSKWREAQLTYGVCLPSPWSWVNCVCAARACLRRACVRWIFLYLVCDCFLAMQPACLHDYVCMRNVWVYFSRVQIFWQDTLEKHTLTRIQNKSHAHTHRRYRVTGCGCIHWKREWQKRCSSSSIVHIHEVRQTTSTSGMHCTSVNMCVVRVITQNIFTHTNTHTHTHTHTQESTW